MTCNQCGRPRASSGSLKYRLLSASEKARFCVGGTVCLKVENAKLKAIIQELTRVVAAEESSGG